MELADAVALVAIDTREGTDPDLTDSEAIAMTRAQVDVEDLADIEIEPLVADAYRLVLAADVTAIDRVLSP